MAKKKVVVPAEDELIPSYASVTGPKAKIYAAELQRIRDKHGLLTTEIIVAEAKVESSPLHDWPGWKGWDRHAASDAYWRLAAGKLVALVKVKVLHDPRADRRPVRALVRVVRDDGQRDLESIFKALTTEEYRSQLIRREIQVMKGCKQRLRDYEELTPVVQALDVAINQAEGVLKKKAKKKAS